MFSFDLTFTIFNYLHIIYCSREFFNKKSTRVMMADIDSQGKPLRNATVWFKCLEDTKEVKLFTLYLFWQFLFCLISLGIVFLYLGL